MIVEYGCLDNISNQYILLMATTTAATTGSNSCLRKTAVAAATAEMNDKLDSTIWLEWVTEHRGVSTANLLDPYVDPAAEKHMTIPRSTSVAAAVAAEPPLSLHQHDDTTHVGMRITVADAHSSPKHCSDNEQRLHEGKRCRTPTSSRRPSSPNRRSGAADDTGTGAATKAVQDIVVSPRIDHDAAVAPYPSSANPDDVSFVTSPRYKKRSKNRRGGGASGNCSVACASTTGGGSIGTTGTSRSAPAAAAATTNTTSVNHHRDIKWRCWHASYPEVTDVEKALDGCNVSQVLQPWQQQQHNSPPEVNNAAVHSSTTSSGTHSAANVLMDLERAMETVHISIPSMASTSMGTTGEHSHDQQQQQQPTRSSPRRSLSTAPALPPSPRPPLHPRAPSGGSLHSQTMSTATTGAAPAPALASNGQNVAMDDEGGLDDSDHPQPEPLLRLSTSTIISQQNAIWEQIQLERQEHLVGFSSVPAPALASQPQPANGASTINPSISRPMERSSSRRSITRQRSHRRTHQERSSSTELDSSRHSRNSRSTLPSTPSSGNLTATATARTPNERSMGGNDTSATTSTPHTALVYRYTKNPRPRDSFSLYSGSSRTSDRSATSSIASSVASAPTTAAHDNGGDGNDEIITVPCLECEAPLHLPTQPDATKLVVYCPVCGTMASSELMRSLIGTTNTSGSENVQAAPKEAMPPGRVTL